MAAIPRLSDSEPIAETEALPSPEAQSSEAASLSRLKVLHGEAEETALLANLLGRSLYVTVTLALASALALVFASTGLERELAWGALMGLALTALMRAYRRAIAASFERAALRSYAYDLNAILLYAGFAWGAGAFLVLAPDAHSAVVFLYSAGIAATLAAILRKLSSSLNFIAPVAVMTAASVLLRALPGALLTASAVLVGCALVAGVAVLASYREALSRRVPLWSDASPV
jgi:hypothetical protein